jgi:hypothetical protein
MIRKLGMGMVRLATYFLAQPGRILKLLTMIADAIIPHPMKPMDKCPCTSWLDSLIIQVSEDEKDWQKKNEERRR